MFKATSEFVQNDNNTDIMNFLSSYDINTALLEDLSVESYLKRSLKNTKRHFNILELMQTLETALNYYKSFFIDKEDCKYSVFVQDSSTLKIQYFESENTRPVNSIFGDMLVLRLYCVDLSSVQDLQSRDKRLKLSQYIETEDFCGYVITYKHSNRHVPIRIEICNPIFTKYNSEKYRRLI